MSLAVLLATKTVMGTDQLCNIKLLCDKTITEQPKMIFAGGFNVSGKV